MKTLLLTLTAVAGLTIATHAEPVYGPREAIRNVAGDIALKHGWHYGRHLTDAARAWMQEAEARGYTEAYCVGKLKDAYYADHNKLPALPPAKDVVRVIHSDSAAAVGLENFHYLLSGIAAASSLSDEHPEIAVKGADALIDTGLRAGNLVQIHAGDSVTVHKLIAMPKYPGVSMASVTYKGLDVLMIVFADTFE
jgi:hypothetical protein